MKKLTLLFIAMTLVGCSTVQMPYYIKAEHPYVRKISGDYGQIIAAIKGVLYDLGWGIQDEVNPSEYERREGGEDQSKDVLFFTEAKRHFSLGCFTYDHLNMFVHATADGAEIDIRYESYTSAGPIKHSSFRNDKLVDPILDRIEQLIDGK